jgi:WD40 repeat protein
VAVANTGSAVLGFGTKLVALDVPGGRVGDTLDQLSGRQGGQIRAVTFSRDGKLLAAGMPTDETGGFGVRLYEWPSGRRLHEFRGHTDRVTALAFSADGKLLASGSEDTSVVVWDLSVVGKR